MTKIEYVQQSWNPVTGCAHAATPGCDHCWARAMAQRLAGRAGYPKADPFAPGTIHCDRLTQPQRWNRPQIVFVCPMGDLWHEKADAVRPEVIAAARRAPHHVYLFLTKRPSRVVEDFTNDRNFWIGATIETTGLPDCQRRLPDLARIKASHKWISAEPLLGRFDWHKTPAVEWIVIGCENRSGRVGRLHLPDHAAVNQTQWWARATALLLHGKAAGIPVFVKQGPIAGRVVHDVDYFPFPRFPRAYPTIKSFARAYPDAMTDHLRTTADV